MYMNSNFIIYQYLYDYFTVIIKFNPLATTIHTSKCLC